MLSLSKLWRIFRVLCIIKCQVFLVFSILQNISTGYPFFQIGFPSKRCIKNIKLSIQYMKFLSNITLNQSTWSISCLFLSSFWTYWLPSHSLLRDYISHRYRYHTHQHANHHHNDTHGDNRYTLRLSLISMAFHS